jgi:hypothetical protein
MLRMFEPYDESLPQKFGYAFLHSLFQRSNTLDTEHVIKITGTVNTSHDDKI